MEFYLYSFFFIFLGTIISYVVLKSLSKTKQENLGFWFLFTLTLKTLFFYLFIHYFLLAGKSFNYNDKIFICCLYMFFVILEVYFVSKLLKREN